MIYTPMTRKAMRIAYDAHAGQVDKTGLPYIYHPMHLAESMTDENSVITALLHDVVEDTDMTIDDLAREVKLADLRHNSDSTRLDLVDEKMARRFEKYARAIRLLEAIENGQSANFHH